ncbi:MAG TPA: exo-alpha-sialidase [Candidatus Limnocylindria bacterium]|nr:exo-alpha-sialidase [Candidatus Limnocylindria bacterium]
MARRSVMLMVGTKKGAYLFRSGAARTRWTSEGPIFPGEPVFHMAHDPRDGESLYAACNFTWGGPKIRASRDLGKTWKVVGNPAFPEGDDRTFARTWHIEPGHASTPKVVWAGVEPAALFRSDDRGASWKPVSGLNDHPTRKKWEPGGGGLALHSIGIDAGDAKHMAIGISAAGAFESTDGGATWHPWNEATRAEHLPNKKPEIGQCVHKLLAHPTRPGEWYQRNHFGVYWRRDGDREWQETTEGLPTEYGFAGATHPEDADTAYTIPLDPYLRIAQQPGLAVYRTGDRGKTWKRMGKGIPKGATAEVMREGMATDRLDPLGVYFGTINGEVWASNDDCRSWERIAEYLPPILSVSTATV